MSKKRRVFDIDFDDADLGRPEPAAAPKGDRDRRGPMAAAISETAEALADRQQTEARIRAENDRLAHEFVALKKAGQIVMKIPLDQVLTSKLTRDRSVKRDEDLDELKISIRDLGLSNPIKVEEVSGGFQLIQGWRRLSAFRELLEETNDQIWAEIPASVQAKGDALEKLYQKMVDENLIRKNLSFGEMATLAVKYSEDVNTPKCTPQEAADKIYASAARQKRSYIRHFTTLYAEIGQHMKHFDAVPRKLGLDLVKACGEDAGLSARILAEFKDLPTRSVDAELAVLTNALRAVPAGTKPKKASSRSTAKTVLKLQAGDGVAKCTASNGRLELQLDRDFSALSRDQLEEAFRAFLQKLAD
ncbi:MAG: ParB N-terminal domain-containing protein [Pelagimonas sp.]|jgi:ParB family chromosome partitioning protein|nr:ParB N-terminal domain-containing protein [Pelagimonas sp.]